MVRILELLGGCDRSPEHPTRWDGKRIIDYCISNLEDSGIEWSLRHEKISDHKVIEGTLTLRGQLSRNFQLVKTNDLSKPVGTSSTIWKNTIRDEWDYIAHPDLPIVDQDSLDKAMEQINDELEQTLTNAMRRVKSFIKLPSHSPKKGSHAQGGGEDTQEAKGRPGRRSTAEHRDAKDIGTLDGTQETGGHQDLRGRNEEAKGKAGEIPQGRPGEAPCSRRST